MSLKPPAGFFGIGTLYYVALIIAIVYMCNNVKALRDRTQNQAIPKV